MFRSCRTCKPSNQPKNSPSLSLSLVPRSLYIFPPTPRPRQFTLPLFQKSIHLEKPILVTNFPSLPIGRTKGGGKREKFGIRIAISEHHILTRNLVGKGRERERERERSPRWKNFRSIFRAESGWEGLRGAERDGKGEEDGGGSIRDPLTRNQKRYARKSDGPVWLENTWNISSILPAGRWECVWQP